MTDEEDPTATTVAVGPDHVMQTAGQWIGVYERGGQATTEVVPANQFFDIPTAFFTYWPRFIYDDLHGRWIGTATSFICDYNQDGDFSDPVGFLDIIVSRTANPEGLWDSWGLGWNGYLPDDVAAGTSTDKVGFSITFWQVPTGCATSALSGSGWVAVDFTELLHPDNRGQPLDSEFDTLFGAPFEGPTYGLRMAHQTPATDAPLYGVAVEIDGDVYRPIYVTIAGRVGTGTIAPTYVDLADSLVATIAEPPPPIQPGGSELVSFLDSTVLTATWRQDRLLYVVNDACTPSGDTTLRDCVRITELSTTAAQAPTRRKDFWIAEAGADNIYGAAGYALDGTFHAVWTRVADEVDGDPASRTAYHPLSSPANSMTSPVDLADADAVMTIPWFQTRSVVAYDPQVPGTAWVANQFGSADGQSFRTHVTSLQVAEGDTFVPIAPLRILDTRNGTGLPGGFQGFGPRTFKVAGAAGGQIPDNAVAITGNLTVTGQTNSGYASVGPIVTWPPTTSTINFPGNDTRANNVTLRLNSDGDLMAIVVGVGGTTHLILDVTGYFLADDSGSTYKPDHRQPGPRQPVRPGRDRSVPGQRPANVPGHRLRWRAGRGDRGHRQPDGRRAIEGWLRHPRPRARRDPRDLDDQLPARRYPGERRDRAALGRPAPCPPCSRQSGGSTDLIFDVTGYYVDDLTGLRFYPLNPGRIMDTRFDDLTQLFGPFLSSTPRLLETAGHFGVPESALAVTGNLTVVGQTKAGYVSITKNPTANPTVSTLNFPLGDVRANGVTVQLNDAGKLAITYKATSGARTHLILDLTGYFR